VGSDGSDPLFEFMRNVSNRDAEVRACPDIDNHAALLRETQQQQQLYYHHQQQQDQCQQHTDKSLNSSTDTTVHHEDAEDLQAFFDTSLPFDFDTWNELCTNDQHLTTTNDVFSPQTNNRSTSGSFDSTGSSLESSGTKRKMSSVSAPAAQGRKKRAVNKNQPHRGKDLIACVIASLPSSVIEEQQKAIPTAFPSRMRRTRVQAAIKAQTDAMVQSCQQRILKTVKVDDMNTSCNVPQVSPGSQEGVKYIGAYTLEERRLRIARFHEKRKQRIWQHTVKYNCRRKLAVGRVRVKGRFVKSEE